MSRPRMWAEVGRNERDERQVNWTTDPAGDFEGVYWNSAATLDEDALRQKFAYVYGEDYEIHWLN